MCLDEHELSFKAGDTFLTRKGDLCNKNLSLSRDLVCQALNACVKASGKTLNCLDGNSPCGLMGMLWKKYLGANVKVDINGQFSHSLDVIRANVESNKLDVNVVREDPCVWLRQNSYDFIYLNCKTSASSYFDSVFSRVRDGAVVVVTTSEDPSLNWQSPGAALRNYGGFIVRTSYFRELGVRLVLAEMARAAARYGKGINVLFCSSFKIQQSFTIIVKIKKGVSAAVESVKAIKKVLHCSMCEDRVYAPNSEYALDSPTSLLSCDCRKHSDMKVTHVLGPVWAGDIFCPEFIERMIVHGEDLPWGNKTRALLTRILEEARCYDHTEKEEPAAKKSRQERRESVDSDSDVSSFQPSFYFNTHRHHPLAHRLLKISSIVDILRRGGFRASRTHFEPECVRTNATLREFIQLLND